MADALSERTLVSVVDISPGRTERTLSYHLWRVGRVLRAVGLTFSYRRSASTAYMALAGGTGLYYNALLLLFLRVLRYRVWLHHHSFAYVEEHRSAMSILCRIGGGSCHICLCEHMADVLTGRYGIDRATVVSNAAFMPAEQDTPASRWRDDATLTVGHLSNLCREKGLHDVIDLHRLLRQEGAPVRLLVAGPTVDDESEDAITRYIDEAEGWAVYLGPVYQDAKRGFFSAVDFFVFPTRYRHEAEPLVLLEALAAGVPVIAYGRGCIPNVVGKAGLVIPPGLPFLAEASQAIHGWLKSQDMTELSATALAQYQRVRAAAETNLDRLIRDLTNDLPE